MSVTWKRLFSLSGLHISIILVVMLSGLYIFSPHFFEILELKTLDLRFLVRGPIEPGPEVVIAVIDEKSVDEIGRWPWPRAKIAEMIEKMSKDQPRVVAFDVGFFERDANTNLGLIDRLGREIDRLGVKNPELAELLVREREAADNDLILARTILEIPTPIVLGYFFHMSRDESVIHITPETVKEKISQVVNGTYNFVRLASEGVTVRKEGFFQAFMPEANIKVLSESAAASGYFNMFPDPDGTVRWVPMTIQMEDKYYMPLSLQGLRYYLDDLPTSLFISDLGVEHVAIGDRELPTDEAGRLLVNYRGPAQTFPHYSIADIIAGRVPQGAFKDKIILVGATAVGIYDLRVTPFDSVFPGIEVHANVVDNILHGDFLIRPGWVAIYDLASIILIGLILGFFLPRLGAMTGPLLGLGLLGTWTGANYFLFLQGLWVNFTYPLATLVVVYTGITIHRYITEEREKKKIRGAFSHYVSHSVVNEMLKNPDMLKLGGDKRIMTVLFSDIRGFTTISEGLDPERLVHLLNRYLTAMTNLVFKHDGLVDKYIGDAIMAVWGAPLSQPKHALLACRTSLEMMSELNVLRQQWAEEDPDIPYIDIGIGLNSGPMVVGNMGSELRFDYTVMGDSVNLGSRLEGANKQYGTNIIIGEITFAQVSDVLYCRELDSVAVKGKEMPTRIYELLGEPGRVPDEKLHMARAFRRGLKAYRDQRWSDAEKIFTAIKCYYPNDRPSDLYLERIAELKQNPPPAQWDGVFVMKTK